MNQGKEIIHWVADDEFGIETACGIKIEGLEDLEITPDGDCATCVKCKEIYHGSK